jgi:hypothetical protein
MNQPARGVEELRGRCEALKRQLSEVAELRPGSLVERYRRCGKANCHCAQPGARGHGPCFSLTRTVEGKTVTHVIAADGVEQTRRQLEEYRRFRALVHALVETSERLCQALLATPAAASEAEAAKKRGSRNSSTARSPAKSRR